MPISGTFRCGWAVAAAMAGFSAGAAAQQAIPPAEAKALFLKGDYAGCLEKIQQAQAEGGASRELAALEIRALLETGGNQEAFNRSRQLWRRGPFDAELALAVVAALKAIGDPEQARELAMQAAEMPVPAAAPGNSRQAVAAGLLRLEGGTDAKTVLDRHLEPARKADPDGRDAWLAIGRLALANHDRKLAAEHFREGLKRFPNDPDFALGLEQSGVGLPEDQQKPEDGLHTYLDVALRANPRSTAALLCLADGQASRKKFAEAKATLAKLLEVNPAHPEAWAEKAAIALLEEQPKEAEKALDAARESWPGNPRVPETIGVTLAAHYRFAEAIGFLRRASELDPQSASIRLELGSNQLRFGQMEEGWANVARAHEGDPYNVAAFNLITLRDKLAGFPVVEKDGVRLRMSPEDMAVFGPRALELVARAKRMLAEKYKVTLSQPVMVEMLPKQEDFAIRTFGLPGGEAFLGVCFGPLITTTSPRGRLGRANWEAVLWHEMAHTITLEMTRHRIPRWLSEGISVFEERQVRPGWGQEMTSEYRDRFLSGRMPEIAKLDDSFTGPDIMFGYYHASLVVEFVVNRFGFDALLGLLNDLGEGKPLDASLAKRTLPLAELETAFREHASKQAAAYGRDLEWAPLGDDEYVAYRDDPAGWVAAHPKRYAAVMMRAAKLVADEDWNAAKALLEKIVAAEPANHEPFNPWQSLAAVCRGLGDADGERAALEKLVALDANASDAAARLLELSASQPAAARLTAGDRMLETNPFQEQAYRTLVHAARETGDKRLSQAATTSLLALGPRDAGRLHYELAVLLRDTDPRAAKRQVLKALEENPRFELALELLVRLPATP